MKNLSNTTENNKLVVATTSFLIAFIALFLMQPITASAQWSTGDSYTGGYTDYGGGGGYSDYDSWSTGDSYTGGYTDYSDWGTGYDSWNTGGSSTGYDSWNTGGDSGCGSGGCGGFASNGTSYTGGSQGGCSGSSCGGSQPGGISRGGGGGGGGGFNLGLNYAPQDNDWTYTDNSDNSVNINEDNDTTTTTITNTTVEDSYNTNSNNRTEVVQRSNDDDDRDMRVQCIVSDSSVELGDLVSYRVEVSGGNSPFDIEWRGAVDGNDQEERIRYNQLGTYSVSVIVEDDDGRRASDNCTSVTVGNAANTGTFVSSGTTYVTPTYVQPTGQLASLSAVSLSQVPYTGPADVLKVLGVIALLVMMSVGGAYYLRKRRGTSAVSNSIAAFKQANKQAVSIR